MSNKIKTIKVNKQTYMNTYTRLGSDVVLDKLGTTAPTIVPFRDINGSLYVATHGIKQPIYENSNKLNPPKMRLEQWNTTLDFRRYLERLGIARPNEKINLICCYGGLIENPPSANTEIVNNTEYKCILTIDKPKPLNNNYTLSVYN